MLVFRSQPVYTVPLSVRMCVCLCVRFAVLVFGV